MNTYEKIETAVNFGKLGKDLFNELAGDAVYAHWDIQDEKIIFSAERNISDSYVLIAGLSQHSISAVGLDDLQEFEGEFEGISGIPSEILHERLQNHFEFWIAERADSILENILLKMQEEEEDNSQNFPDPDLD
jgi:hypothetical protein